ncbi:MAG: HlyD family type I secretion periplasmic adaptor subunit [Desulfarculus sp.]|nr:HlyD family type I secretion periplasmic adaptor subunit [Desulfarculus sp.]
MEPADRRPADGLKTRAPRRAGQPGLGLAAVAVAYQPDAVELEEKLPPGGARWSLYLLLLLLVVAVLWASLSQVDRVVVARGRMVTTAPTIVVQPMETAVIHEIAVRVGQVVAPGALLASLDPTFTQADVAQQRSRLKSYAAQVRRLEAEINQRPFAPQAQGDQDERLQADIHHQRQAAFQARQKGFQQGIARLEASLATNHKEQQVLAQRLKGLQEIEGMRATLAKERHESRLRVLEAQNQRLEVERELKQAVSREAEIRHEISKGKAEAEAFVQGWRQELSEELVKAVRERDQASEQLNKAARRGELVALRAPAAAMVLEIAKRSAGSVVKEAEPLFTLVPLEVPLEAEVQVEARDIGFVRAGDQVRLKFDAFPYQKHGTARARVQSLSEDLVQQTQMAEGGEERRGGMFYIGRLRLEELKLGAVPEDFRLLPGMTVTAEIKVGQRRVITYLLYPVMRGFDESLREP